MNKTSTFRPLLLASLTALGVASTAHAANTVRPSAAALAAAPTISPLASKQSGQAFVIGGQRWFKVAASRQNANLRGTGKSAASAPGNPPDGLYIGDELHNEDDAVPGVVSGGLLVNLKAADSYASVAKRYNLSVQFRTRDMVLLKAPAGVELQALTQQLAADPDVQAVELELVSNRAMAN
ncbi:hypothetical protein KSF73_01045 [Burkholderiaceae bacterium DAT-1]|nr:hypothetical protein [Burkholderiaceae bacterium DAT-1]